MKSLLEQFQNTLYPFEYFLVLFVVLQVSRFSTLFFVAVGRLKSFHALENYWIYLLVFLFCAILGMIFGYGNLLQFARWFVCSLLAALIGIHMGYNKGIKVDDEELEDIEDEIKRINKQ